MKIHSITGLHRAMHDTTAACQQGNFVQVHIKRMDTVIFWIHCILNIGLVLLFQELNIHSKKWENYHENT
jgi:hypothetical protein